MGHVMVDMVANMVTVIYLGVRLNEKHFMDIVGHLGLD